MNDPKQPVLLDHDADGIRELDNLLPRWWIWLFYLTVIYSVVYMAYFHVLKAGALQVGEYEQDFKAGEQIKAAAIAKFESSLRSVQPAKDKMVLDKGQQIFTASCAPCHRADGGGLVGPNLCDNYWIHGEKFEDSMKVIWNGIPEKGMVTWKGVLKPEEIHAVASYIYMMRGSNPANPKPPENQQPASSAPSIYE